jgi:hypothetical protein
MPAHWLYRYYFGFLLPRICDLFGWPKEAIGPLHEALKEAFDINSTTFLDENDFLCYIDSIHGLWVVEFGKMIPHINEPPNVDEIDMETFLSLYK